MMRSGAGPEQADSGACTLVLLQAAACQARIGPFALRELATPQSAVSLYRAAARLAVASARR